MLYTLGILREVPVKLKVPFRLSLCMALCTVVNANAPLALATSPATTATLTVTSNGNAVTSVASGGVVTLTATVLAGTVPVTSGHINFCNATAKFCTDIHLLGLAQLTSSGKAVFRFHPGIGSHSY